jgi:hypothetical protein
MALFVCVWGSTMILCPGLASFDRLGKKDALAPSGSELSGYRSVIFIEHGMRLNGWN